MSNALQLSKERLLSDGDAFVVPEKAIYFCIHHQLFIETRPEAERHMKCKQHITPGSVQCTKCLNWYSGKRDLRHHIGLVGEDHKLPFPCRKVMILKSGRISGGGEEEAAEECTSGVEKKVMVINLPCIQAVTPKMGEFI